jgi:hypothetical protein
VKEDLFVFAAFLVTLVSVAATPRPVVFLSPDDLMEAQGVSVEAQLPQAGLALEAKDPQRPKLWYAPVAAEATARGARIWYQRVNSAEAEFSDQRVLCLGEIRNGAWNPRTLDPKPPAWGGVNNVCMRRSPYKPTWGGFNVFQIIRNGHEYRMLYWDQPNETGQAGAMLAASKDGTRWQSDPGTVFTEHNDAFTLLSCNGEYLVYQTALEDWPDKPYADNLDKKRRVISIRRSKDLRIWTPQEILLRPDAQDKPDTEFYLMKAFRHGDGFAGLLMKYYADPKLPGRHSAILQNELIVSKDAVHWERPFRGTDTGFWSYADPFLVQGRLHFAIWKDGGMCTVTYSPNRLTGVCAGSETGSFMTRPFHYARPPHDRGPAGGSVSLDADARNGWIETELLDVSGRPVQGVRPQRVENTEGVCIKLKLGGDKPLAGIPSEYRMRFRLRNARLFALLSDGSA